MVLLYPHILGSSAGIHIVPENLFYVDFLLFAGGFRDLPLSCSVMLATPGFKVIIAKVLSFLPGLEEPNLEAVLDCISNFIGHFNFSNPANLSELMEGAGGTIDDLAGLVVQYIRIVVGRHPQYIRGICFSLRDAEPSLETKQQRSLPPLGALHSILLYHGLVGALVAAMLSVSTTAGPETSFVLDECFMLLERILLAPPGYLWIEEAIDDLAGLVVQYIRIVVGRHPQYIRGICFSLRDAEPSLETKQQRSLPPLGALHSILLYHGLVGALVAAMLSVSTTAGPETSFVLDECFMLLERILLAPPGYLWIEEAMGYSAMRRMKSRRTFSLRSFATFFSFFLDIPKRSSSRKIVKLEQLVKKPVRAGSDKIHDVVQIIAMEKFAAPRCRTFRLLHPSRLSPELSRAPKSRFGEPDNVKNVGKRQDIALKKIHRSQFDLGLYDAARHDGTVRGYAIESDGRRET
ncbi:hypothetical protein B0H14DRAFT_3629756 [Mycena olivaceomarginata]|nr:hypothetical protein B0H14DRAFT_3629756 [Mycena olivaceomarginata]